MLQCHRNEKTQRDHLKMYLLQQNLFISLGNIFYGMGRGFCGTWWKIRSVMIFFASPPFFMKHIIFRPPPPPPPVLIKITGGVLYIYPLILRYDHSNIYIYIFFFTVESLNTRTNFETLPHYIFVPTLKLLTDLLFLPAPLNPYPHHSINKQPVHLIPL